jgi:translation initiation factor 2 alpha subunit (eIF-2alpha)
MSDSYEEDPASAAPSNDTDPSTAACRMYEKPYPEVGDLVMARIDKIREIGAEVSLMEYKNAQGMLLWPDVTRKRVRSFHKLLHVGRIEPMSILRIDTIKGYMDVSKKNLTVEDVKQAQLRYRKAKVVHAILGQVAKASKVPLAELYKVIAWPLYRECGHAYDAFVKIDQQQRAGEDFYRNRFFALAGKLLLASSATMCCAVVGIAFPYVVLVAFVASK